MSRLYGPVHRLLQDRFDTRRLADNVETRVVLTEIPQEHKAFIESRDMFFLSTIDHQGRPTVSYKGGDPGFVRVLGSKTLAFPCYDGNGIGRSPFESKFVATESKFERHEGLKIKEGQARPTPSVAQARSPLRAATTLD